MSTFFATNIFPGDGVTTAWDFSFAGVDPDAASGTTPYLYAADVYATELYRDVNNNPVALQRTVTIDPSAPNRAIIAGAPVAIGRQIKIYRQTEVRFPLVDYRGGQSVSDTDLDLANRQAILIAQETRDAAANNIQLDVHDNYDMRQRRAVNLAPGIDPQDAVNKSQLDRTVRVPDSEAAISALPSAAVRANRVLGFDAAGNVVTVLPASGSAADLAIDLANAIVPTRGAGQVGYSGRTVRARLDDAPTPKDKGAVGDGVTLDDAAFAAIELVAKGRIVDLGGATYAVTTMPILNTYINGAFKIEGFSRISSLINSLHGRPVYAKKYGGQLSDMYADLLNPLVQAMGIVFIGDSITWGSGTGENSPTEPRTGFLSDPRDYATTANMPNLFREHLVRQLGLNSTVTYSNWPTSSAGQCIALITLQEQIQTIVQNHRFTITTPAGAAGMTLIETFSPSLKTGKGLRMANASANDQGHRVEFQFTGTTFTLYHSVVEATGTYYEVYVDGVLQGLRSTHIADNPGWVNISVGNPHVWTFGHVTNKTVAIQQRRNGETGTRELRLDGIGITRKIRVTNQGINGASSTSYLTRNLTTGDNMAVKPDDLYCFVQTGTNDRIKGSVGGSQFDNEQRYRLMLAGIPATAKKILMCANPATNEDPAIYYITMQQVRGMIQSTAKALSLDFIDNYSSLRSLGASAWTADGLHPTVFGYSVIARNILDALEG